MIDTKERDEAATKHNETLQYFENITFDQVFKNGWNARDPAFEQQKQEISRLMDENTQLKKENDKLKDHFENCNAEKIVTLREKLAEAAVLIGKWGDKVCLLKEEVEVLRLFGNKDCTAMADEHLAKRRLDETN